MKSSELMTVMFAATFSCFCSFKVAANDFVLIKKESDISLYQRWVRSGEGESVREIKLTFSVHADVRGVVSLLSNEAKGKDWNKSIKEYKVLGSGSDAWITYIRYDIPWPLDDQDCCLAYKIVKPALGSKITEIQFSSIYHSQFPMRNDVGRMQGVKGKWLMEAKDGGGLSITYLATIDGSKSIPRWVSDPIVQKQLIKTFSAFTDLLEKQKL